MGTTNMTIHLDPRESITCVNAHGVGSGLISAYVHVGRGGQFTGLSIIGPKGAVVEMLSRMLAAAEAVEVSEEVQG